MPQCIFNCVTYYYTWQLGHQRFPANRFMVQVPGKFWRNTAMRLRVTVRKRNMTGRHTDGQTDRWEAFQFSRPGPSAQREIQIKSAQLIDEIVKWEILCCWSQFQIYMSFDEQSLRETESYYITVNAVSKCHDWTSNHLTKLASKHTKCNIDTTYCWRPRDMTKHIVLFCYQIMWHQVVCRLLMNYYIGLRRITKHH